MKRVKSAVQATASEHANGCVEVAYASTAVFVRGEQPGPLALDNHLTTLTPERRSGKRSHPLVRLTSVESASSRVVKKSRSPR
ncbi:hypothetical protein GCM10023205_01480 [Yinghuangia aomiensis]|uniref:DUF397 domain-containing protein n=1 Tax=Yinghuangia aomiensis TaxID=676205 RepID=A0ABP9GMV4_9ACTN